MQFHHFQQWASTECSQKMKLSCSYVIVLLLPFQSLIPSPTFMPWSPPPPLLFLKFCPWPHSTSTPQSNSFTKPALQHPARINPDWFSQSVVASGNDDPRGSGTLKPQLRSRGSCQPPATQPRVAWMITFVKPPLRVSQSQIWSRQLGGYSKGRRGYFSNPTKGEAGDLFSVISLLTCWSIPQSSLSAPLSTVWWQIKYELLVFKEAVPLLPHDGPVFFSMSLVQVTK